MINDLRQVWAMLPARLRARWMALIPLNVLAAGAEALGASLVFGFIAVVSSADGVQSLPVLASWLPQINVGDTSSVLLSLGSGLIAFYLVRAILLAAVAYAHEGLLQRSTEDLTKRMLWRYLHAPYAFHLSHNSSVLIQRLGESVPAGIGLVLSSAAHMTGEMLVGLGLVVILALASPVATLVALGLTVALLLVSSAASKSAFLRWGERRQQLDEELLIELRQSLGALREIRLAGREAFFHQSVTSRRDALGRAAHHQAALTSWLRLGVETAFFVAMVAVVTLASLRFGSGADVIATVGLFAYATFRLVPTANRVVLHLGSIRSGHAYVADLHADFVTLPAVPPPLPATEVERLAFVECIGIERVSYTYAGADHPAVSDVDLRIARGASIGIVGRTGAGKTTLVALLLGLLEPSSGRIVVDGQDVTASAAGWRALLGYVPQEVYLVDDTLRRNVAFGYADEEVDERRLQQAVARSRLDEFVGGLPQGLDSVVGEAGVRLSGGQRQRVAIARALYREPEVLVFDEAMSALDLSTEQEIARAIDALRGQITLIVVTHRLSSVRGCDRILVMDQGRIAAVGAYDELLRDHPPFRALAGSPDL